MRVLIEVGNNLSVKIYKNVLVVRRDVSKHRNETECTGGAYQNELECSAITQNEAGIVPE